jgi:hypothetical protein
VWRMRSGAPGTLHKRQLPPVLVQILKPPLSLPPIPQAPGAGWRGRSVGTAGCHSAGAEAGRPPGAELQHPGQRAAPAGGLWPASLLAERAPASRARRQRRRRRGGRAAVLTGPHAARPRDGAGRAGRVLPVRAARAGVPGRAGGARGADIARPALPVLRRPGRPAGGSGRGTQASPRLARDTLPHPAAPAPPAHTLLLREHITAAAACLAAPCPGQACGSSARSSSWRWRCRHIRSRLACLGTSGIMSSGGPPDPTWSGSCQSTSSLFVPRRACSYHAHSCRIGPGGPGCVMFP